MLAGVGIQDDQTRYFSHNFRVSKLNYIMHWSIVIQTKNAALWYLIKLLSFSHVYSIGKGNMGEWNALILGKVRVSDVILPMALDVAFLENRIGVLSSSEEDGSGG